MKRGERGDKKRIFICGYKVRITEAGFQIYLQKNSFLRNFFGCDFYQVKNFLYRVSPEF